MRAKTAKRAYIGSCLVCGEADPAALDCHRALVPGKDGGGYGSPDTLMVLCATCHRKAHAGSIAVLGRHLGTSGRYFWRCRIDGAERLIPDTPPWRN